MSDGGRDALRGYSKKIRLAYLGLWMHTDISACGDAPCWVYSNENVSGQSMLHFVRTFLIYAWLKVCLL